MSLLAFIIRLIRKLRKEWCLMATVQQLVDATAAQAQAASALNTLVTERVVPVLEGIGDRIDPVQLDPVLAAIEASTVAIDSARTTLADALPPQ